MRGEGGSDSTWRKMERTSSSMERPCEADTKRNFSLMRILQNSKTEPNYFCTRAKKKLWASPKGWKIKVSNQNLDARI